MSESSFHSVSSPSQELCSDSSQFQTGKLSRIVAFTSCGYNLWTAYENGLIEVYCMTSENYVTSINRCEYYSPSKEKKLPPVIHSMLACLNGGREWMICGNESGRIEVYDPLTFQLSTIPNDHHMGAILTISEYNGFLFTGSADFHIGMWDIPSFRIHRQFQGHSSYIRNIIFEGNNLYSGADDGIIRLWDISSLSACVLVRHHFPEGICSMCCVGREIWSIDVSSTIFIWDKSTTEILYRIPHIFSVTNSFLSSKSGAQTEELIESIPIPQFQEYTDHTILGDSSIFRQRGQIDRPRIIQRLGYRVCCISESGHVIFFQTKPPQIVSQWNVFSEADSSKVSCGLFTEENNLPMTNLNNPSDSRFSMKKKNDPRIKMVIFPTCSYKYDICILSNDNTVKRCKCEQECLMTEDKHRLDNFFMFQESELSYKRSNHALLCEWEAMHEELNRYKRKLSTSSVTIKQNEEKLSEASQVIDGLAMDLVRLMNDQRMLSTEEKKEKPIFEYLIRLASEIQNSFRPIELYAGGTAETQQEGVTASHTRNESSQHTTGEGKPSFDGLISTLEGALHSLSVVPPTVTKMKNELVSLWNYCISLQNLVSSNRHLIGAPVPSLPQLSLIQKLISQNLVESSLNIPPSPQEKSVVEISSTKAPLTSINAPISVPTTSNPLNISNISIETFPKVPANSENAFATSSIINSGIEKLTNSSNLHINHALSFSNFQGAMARDTSFSCPERLMQETVIPPRVLNSSLSLLTSVETPSQPVRPISLGGLMQNQISASKLPLDSNSEFSKVDQESKFLKGNLDVNDFIRKEIIQIRKEAGLK